MRAGSLFSGYGGLDMAVHAVFGGRPAWWCEVDSDATRVLAHHWPHVPNLGDITTVNWGQVDPVDILTAGWPCQPWSSAGKRKGTADDRALWPEVARALRTLRPRIVVLENVAAIVGAGELARACGDLAALGYRFGWSVLGASDVGAPHRRHRCFIVAAADAEGDGWDEGRTEPARLVGGSDVAFGGGATPADADRVGHSRSGGERHGWPGLADGCQPAPDSVGAGLAQRQRLGGDPRPELPTAERGDREVDWGQYGPAIRRWEVILGRPAPEPTVTGARGSRKLAPRLVEWMMGLPAGHVTDVPGLSTNAQLRMLGNGVVPQQAEMAIRMLRGQLIEDATRGVA